MDNRDYGDEQPEEPPTVHEVFQSFEDGGVFTGRYWVDKDTLHIEGTYAYPPIPRLVVTFVV